MIKIIIFDFDGTIGNTQQLIVKTLHDTIDKLNLTFRSDAECISTIGLPLEKAFMSLYSDEGKGDDVMFGKECAGTYRKLFEKNNIKGAVSMFPNVKETMERLYSMGIVMTIATSRGRESLQNFLEEMDIMRYISYTVCNGDVENAKPAPDMVVKTLEQLHFKAHEAMVVGDTSFDIIMGKKGGCITCGVTYGNGGQQELLDAGANHIINNFSDILKILRLEG